MKAFLMHKDRDFELPQESRLNEQALIQDLELTTLFNAMSLGNEFLFEVAKNAILWSLNNDLDTILYRQNILKDCLRNPALIRHLYDIAVETIEARKKHHYGIFTHYPGAILREAVNMLQMFVGQLKKLKMVAEENADKFESAGFTAFFAMLGRELADDYFTSIQNHLKELKFRGGVLISAELGKGNEGTNYVLRKSQDKNQNWVKQAFTPRSPVYTVYIHPRDESGARALTDLENRGINLVANALAQSCDHILSFFTMLRTELAFYVGCLNLQEQLSQMGEPISFPTPVTSSERRHSLKGLYDICLTLTMRQRIVGNDVDADGKDLVMITGANQGGKSTFLRAVGLAQLMMQCGMFVPAESLCANICNGLFTHYKREEDTTMKSGKLDEELNRMSDIVDQLMPHAMVLFNESFASTNEREGSEIARQIINALIEKRIKVFYVTHLYDLADSFYNRKMENATFLRAERQADGRRTFKLVEGEPLQTSYGEDLYYGIFGTDNAAG
ncbi:MAG: DNA mismatch repair protein MutS [Anaerolineae bacterium]|nr:DNA mismatch repair protein MutS [Anaerolineae bacterium]